MGLLFSFFCIVIQGQTYPVQVSAAGRRGSLGSRLAACLHQQVKGRAGHQFELALLLPRAWPSRVHLPVGTVLGLARGGSRSCWHTGPLQSWELLESSGLNVWLHALNLPLVPSGTGAVGTTRLLCSFSMARERGGARECTSLHSQHLPGGCW